MGPQGTINKNKILSHQEKKRNVHRVMNRSKAFDLSSNQLKQSDILQLYQKITVTWKLDQKPE